MNEETDPLTKLQEIVKKKKGRLYYDKDKGELVINLYYKKPDDEMINSILDLIPRINPLSYLKIDLGENKLGDNKLIEVAERISRISKDRKSVV